LAAWPPAAAPLAAAAATPAPAPFAVVELFTSEGCSSCPPADALLAELSARDDVLALSFHVTYWDHLGWRDRFSSPAYTARQDAYAHRFGLASLYTPQMVVNGERQFVGSDESAAHAAIRDGLARTDALPITLRTRADGPEVVVDCTAPGAPADARLEVAWVDERATSSPDRGENGGRTLHHVHVARDLRRVALDQRHHGGARLRPPDAGPGRVIAWLEAANGGRVLGAAASGQLGR
ncbi:MAG TPA: DUF1223 domain-containing protein, partial [Dongiaceae bacterium]|nr:DUF1223 domain-containing protein [Dongiaceae bacterium]